MKLQLHVNGYLFKEMPLPAADFENQAELNYRENVDRRKLLLCKYAKFMEAKYFRQIDKVKEWCIVAVVRAGFR